MTKNQEDKVNYPLQIIVVLPLATVTEVEVALALRI